MAVSAAAAMATSVSKNAARSASACARERDDLRLLDEAHDAGERGLLAGARHLDAQRAVPVDRAGDDLVARRLVRPAATRR